MSIKKDPLKQIRVYKDPQNVMYIRIGYKRKHISRGLIPKLQQTNKSNSPNSYLNSKSSKNK